MTELRPLELLAAEEPVPAELVLAVLVDEVVEDCVVVAAAALLALVAVLYVLVAVFVAVTRGFTAAVWATTATARVTVAVLEPSVPSPATAPHAAIIKAAAAPNARRRRTRVRRRRCERRAAAVRAACSGLVGRCVSLSMACSLVRAVLDAALMPGRGCVVEPTTRGGSTAAWRWWCRRPGACVGTYSVPPVSAVPVRVGVGVDPVAAVGVTVAVIEPVPPAAPLVPVASVPGVEPVGFVGWVGPVAPVDPAMPV